MDGLVFTIPWRFRIRKWSHVLTLFCLVLEQNPSRSVDLERTCPNSVNDAVVLLHCWHLTMSHVSLFALSIENVPVCLSCCSFLWDWLFYSSSFIGLEPLTHSERRRSIIVMLVMLRACCWRNHFSTMEWSNPFRLAIPVRQKRHRSTNITHVNLGS